MREYPDQDQDVDEAGEVSADGASLHRRLLADGDGWRRRLPTAVEAIRRAREQTVQPLSAARSSSAPGRSASGSAPKTIDERATGSLGVGIPAKGHVSMMTGRIRGLATGMAAIAVVALIALLFHALAAGRAGTAPGTTTTSASETPAPVAHGIWQTLAGLSYSTPQNGTSVLPAIAPTDPRTAFKATLDPAKLQRTTDAGAHWTELHVPGDTSHVEDFQVFVSPLDTSHVFITLTSPLPPQSQPSACPTLTASLGQQAELSTRASGNANGVGVAPERATAPRSGSIPCSLQYYSTDGGGSWQQLTLPVRSALVAPNSFLAMAATRLLHAQGTRLFAAAGCGPLCAGPSMDILTSADGGGHWALADHDIRAAGDNVCDFDVSPSGNDVFAITAAESCGNESVPPAYLWHSRDGGAHWTRVGRLPSDGWFGLAVVAQTQGQPLLYVHLPQVTVQGHGTSVVDGPTSLKVSADGGKTWKAAPAAGVTTTLRQYSGPLCVLSDGTVVEVFGDPTTGAGLYGWKLGDAAWHLVAPPLKGTVSQVLVEGQGSSYSLLAVTVSYQSGESATQTTALITVQSYTP